MKNYKLIPKLMALAMGIALVLGSAAMKPKTLKQKMALVMSGTDGHNGAGVAYNPVKKYYYAAFAGNISYPIATFDAKGKVLKSEQTADFDVRGFWYNTKLNRLEGNSYDYTTGYFYRNLDASGFASSGDRIFATDEYAEDTYQPEDNSAGAWIPSTDEILFRSGKTLYFYNRTDGVQKRSREITGLPVDITNINEYTVVYTGLPKMEIGVFDYVLKKVYLIDMATNRFTKELKLPDTIPAESMFNFSYANGMYWFFNTSTRTWYGYK